MPLSPTYTNWSDFCLEPPFVVLFAAPRKAGKTVLLNHLLRECWNKQFDNIVIVSPTLKYNDEYGGLEDKLSQRTKLIKVDHNLPATLSRVIREQKELAIRHKDNPSKYPSVETLVVLDDCIDENLFRYNSIDNVVDEIAHTGRHYGLSVALTSQSLSKISPETRKNAEALFVFSPLNFMDFERTMEEYVPRAFRRKLRDAVTEAWKEQYSFVIFDGSPERRQNLKDRLRKGFSELLFEKDHKEDERVPENVLVKNKKRKEPPVHTESVKKE